MDSNKGLTTKAVYSTCESSRFSADMTTVLDLQARTPKNLGLKIFKGSLRVMVVHVYVTPPTTPLSAGGYVDMRLTRTAMLPKTSVRC